jgi:oligoribonuclease NrnB/cAMP/cGMP phosphodiesterase (DHH superfamily)
MKPPLVLYHAGCPDGFCSAWVAWLYFGGEVECRPVSYGTLPPYDDAEGRMVFLVDYSYSRAEMEQLAARAGELTILDHHPTAQERLKGFGSAVVVFDMERSGAAITWDYFLAPTIKGSKRGERPPIVDYVQDRDLWRFCMPRSKEINAWLKSLPYDFVAWDEANKLLEDGIEKPAGYGEILLTKLRTYCQQVSKNAREIALPVLSEAVTAQLTIPCVNAPQVDVSELLHHLAEERAAEVVVAWWQRADGLVQVSVRSKDESGFSAREIAEFYGGGGHRNAAGFQIDLYRWANIIWQPF